MEEKLYKFEVDRVQSLVGFVYAESKEEAHRLILSGDVEFEQEDTDDTIVSLVEEDRKDKEESRG